MKRFLLTAAASAGAALTLAGPAAAAVSEIGAFDGSLRGSCPEKPCYALSRTTGYQAKVGDDRGIMTAPADGRLVAMTLGLGIPGKTQMAFFEKNLGGKSTAQLTVLNPRTKLRSRAVAQGESVDLEPFFGTTAQIPLRRSVPIKKGQVVAITTQTWAPILAVKDQPTTTSWRASRGRGTCDDVGVQKAQTGANQLAQYFCLYRGARLAYSATFIPDPAPAAAATRARG